MRNSTCYPAPVIVLIAGLSLARGQMGCNRRFAASLVAWSGHAGGLLLKRFGQLPRALLFGFKQPHVFDRNQRLVGKNCLIVELVGPKMALAQLWQP